MASHARHCRVDGGAYFKDMAFRDPFDRMPLSKEEDRQAQGCTSILLVVVAILALGRGAAWGWNWLASKKPPDGWGAALSGWLQVLVVVLAIGTALALYWLRQRRPRIYAGLEFFVACSAAWVAVSAHQPLEEGLKFAAAVYLMVRSFDNWRRSPEAARRTN